ncbi:MAG TPA: M48 family metallopeptidase [Acidimicrobiales bacterium]|nr:M48 family metallopeptidase [Acidimicrobiales bacterium]
MALVVAFVALVAIAAWAFNAVVGYGLGGLVVALVFAVGASALSYWKSDAIALAMSHAKPADPAEYARFHNVVEGLCIAAGLPKPRLYVIDDPAPNAFATGRNPKHAALAVTTGLLEKMSRVELEGVMAHELGHVKNYDILVSTLAVTLVGVIALMSDWALRFVFWGGSRRRNDSGGGGAGAVVALLGFALLLLTPLVAKLMQFAISRRREALADVSGVTLTRYPPGLISALEKLRDDDTVVHSGSRATAHLWIEAPVARIESEGKLAWLGRMFNTHPPLDERIAALREL